MSTALSVLMESPSDPLVTIAIPTFNRASWLKDCVHSALAQTYQNFEVLVLDNASTDETQAVLSEFNDRRLRVVKQQTNIGLLPNWNACLAEAKGTYIVLVPDDDKIAPWMLERCLALAKSEANIPIIITLCDHYSTTLARLWPAAVSRKFGTGIWDGADILQEFLNGYLDVQMCGIMIQTAVFLTRKGFPIDFPYAGDKAGWAPLLLSGRAGFVNESCATFYIHNESQSGRSAIDICVNDESKFADLIISLIDCFIEDPRKRRKVKLAAKRYAARRAIQILAAHRKGGAKLSDVLSILARWRRNLISIGIVNVFRLGRPLVVLLFPGPVADLIIRLLRPVHRIAVSRKP